VLAVSLARARIHAVRGDDEVAVREVFAARLRLEAQIDAQLAATGLKELQERDARAAAEAVSSAAQGAALVDDFDVVPVAKLRRIDS